MTRHDRDDDDEPGTTSRKPPDPEKDPRARMIKMLGLAVLIQFVITLFASCQMAGQFDAADEARRRLLRLREREPAAEPGAGTSP